MDDMVEHNHEYIIDTMVEPHLDFPDPWLGASPICLDFPDLPSAPSLTRLSWTRYMSNKYKEK
jgi:hypothetical protein